jgi:hypothetical protein
LTREASSARSAAATFIGTWLAFVLTGLVLGWGTGYVIAVAGWLVLLALTAKARP